MDAVPPSTFARLHSPSAMMQASRGSAPVIPSLCPAPPVAELYLSHCTSLMALPSTIDVLAHLVAIDLRSCTRLESLPAALARLPKVMATRMPRHGHSKPAVN